MRIRRAEDRGLTNLGWLKSHHTFSFGDYFDQKHMGFHTLRVINDDLVAPGKGFDSHPHRNMEIVTIPLAGALAHQDSAGNSGVITRGMVQRMTAGKGIIHSEMNASKSEPVHFLQIWIEPEEKNLVPSYEEFTFEWPRNSSVTIGSYRSKYEPKDPARHGVAIHQNLEISLHNRVSGKVEFEPVTDRSRWLQLVSGCLALGQSDVVLKAGDGVSLEKSESLRGQVTGDAALEIIEFSIIS